MTIPMHAGHPFVVHLPLVAFFAAVGFDLVDAWSTMLRFRRAATVLWWAAVAGAAAAIGTGLWAYNHVEHSDAAHVVMTLHRNVALATIALLLGAGVWRWLRPRSRPAAIVALVGLAGLAWVGDLGADLVFRHALGLPSARLAEILDARRGEDMAEPHAHGTMPPAPAVMPDSTAAGRAAATPSDSGHTHKRGKPHAHSD